MALLVFEGFEGAGTTNGSGTGATNLRDYMMSRYVVNFSTTTNTAPRPENGFGWGKALSWGGDTNSDLNWIDFALGKSVSEGWCGFAIKPRLTEKTVTTITQWRSSSHSENHIDMRVYQNAHLLFYLDTFTQKDAFIPHALEPDKWTYIEVRMKISNTAGEIEVKINGVQRLNLTSTDTQGDSGSTEFDTVRMVGGEGLSNTDTSEQWFIDDFYALDASGSSNTTFLGPIKVESLFPTAEGTTINFTPSTGTDNSANVDDNPKNDDTDYNSSSDTASNKDLFTTGNLSNLTGNIKAVQVVNQAKVEEPGAIGLQSIVSEGTPTQGTGSVIEIADPSVYKDVKHIFETNPDTSSAWVVSEVNGMEIGYEID